MVKYKGKATYPWIHMSNYHFYRDLDPLEYPGDDPIDKSLFLQPQDVPGATH